MTRSLAKIDRTITVRVPFQLRKRGGRKLIVAPEGASGWAPPCRVDNAMVKALARAHRWKQILEGGEFATIKDLAAAENINLSYLCRVLRLSLLAPKIIEAILDGRPPAEMTLVNLMKPFPVGWQEQIGLGFSNATPPKDVTA